MINTIRNSCTVVVLAALITIASNRLGSGYLDNFIDCNLITLLVALLAINITTISVVMSKLWEIAEKHSVDFSETVGQMKLSIKEQIFLIILALVLQIGKASPAISKYWTNAEQVVTGLLVAVFLYAILILYDTAKAVFMIMRTKP